MSYCTEYDATDTTHFQAQFRVTDDGLFLWHFSCRPRQGKHIMQLEQISIDFICQIYPTWSAEPLNLEYCIKYAVQTGAELAEWSEREPRGAWTLGNHRSVVQNFFRSRSRA